MKVEVYLGVGGNKGDWMLIRQKAKLDLKVFGIEIIETSSTYKTAAWGKTDQPDFYNEVWRVSFEGSILELLNDIQEVERLNGRNREFEDKWGQRTLDIDILSFEDRIVSIERVDVPHPHLEKRRFVLAPLKELNPNWRHPVSGLTATVLLENCMDTSNIEKF